jgi:polyisoprenyl-teichoic acid--peptidoglycan teichoic acid transferase
VEPSRSLQRVLFRRFGVALALSLILVIVGIAGVNMFIDYKVDQIPRVKVDTAENTDPGEPANFLLIGSDTRQFESLSPLEREAYGDPTAEGGQRSDTIMVVHVEPEEKTGFLVSFPRDLVVDIPGVGQSKINAAFNGGPQRVVDTFKQNFNLDIHHYVEVDFQSFKEIVDAMGGVPVYLRAPARDLTSGFEPFGALGGPAGIPFAFQPGCYVLDGSNALNYVRSRNLEEHIDGEWRTDPRGDLARIERQQAFMRRLATEAFRRSVNSPRTALDIADSTIPKLKADENLNSDDVKKLIRSFRRVNPNDPTSLEMVTFPTVPGPRNSSLGAILQAKQPDAEAVLARLRQFGPTPDQQQGPRPTEIRVSVFNGSGQSGLAAKTQGELINEGFVTVGVGNKPAVRSTQVRYRPGSKDKATVVQSYLGGVGKLIEDDAVTEADVDLVLGKDFRAVTAPADAAPAPAPAGSGTAPPAPSAPATTAGGNGDPGGPTVDPNQC